MEVTSWNVHHGGYFMELTPLKLPHGTYIIEVTYIILNSTILL